MTSDRQWEVLPSDAREALERLRLRPMLMADGRVSGVHISSHMGQSLEFAELKGYAFGDDPRGIDWKVLARTDKVYVRRFHDETNMAAWLILDASASMNQPMPDTKFRYGASVLAALSYVLLRQRDEVGLVLAHSRHPEICPVRSSPSHLGELCQMLVDARPSGPTVLRSALETAAAGMAKRGLVVVASDMLTAEWEATVGALGAIVARGGVAVLAHVLSVEELTFPFSGNLVFRSAETGESALLDARGLRRQYLKAISDFKAAVAQACLKVGVIYKAIDTTQAAHNQAAGIIHAVDFRHFKEA